MTDFRERSPDRKPLTNGSFRRHLIPGTPYSIPVTRASACNAAPPWRPAPRLTPNMASHPLPRSFNAA